MSSMTLVRDYIESLPDESRFIGETAVKELRQNGASWEWLEVALSIKTKDDWAKYGFGLMFTDSFRAQVQKRLQRLKAKKESNIWVEDEDKRFQEASASAFGDDDFTEIWRGSETFRIKRRFVPDGKQIGEMTCEEIDAMIIEQHRQAELFCAHCWPDTYGTEGECLKQYEAEDRELSDEQIARKYLHC